MVSEPTVTVLAIEEPEIIPNRAEPKIDDLGRAAGKAAGDAGGEVDEQLAEADARREHAEQHVVEDVGRDDAERDAVDALAGQVEMVDDVVQDAPGCARMPGIDGPK